MYNRADCYTAISRTKEPESGCRERPLRAATEQERSAERSTKAGIKIIKNSEIKGIRPSQKSEWLLFSATNVRRPGLVSALLAAFLVALLVF